MEKYTATTAAEETTDAKPELVAHVAKTLEGVNEELAGDLVAGVIIIIVITDGVPSDVSRRGRGGEGRRDECPQEHRCFLLVDIS